MSALPPRETAASVLSGLACLAFVLELSDTGPGPPLARSPTIEPRPLGELLVHTTAACPNPPCPSVPGVEVQVHSAVGEQYQVSARAFTDDAGQAVLGVPVGAGWLIAAHSNHARRAIPIAPGAGRTRVELLLEPARVVGVSVRSEAGAPLGGATVLVSDRDALPHGARSPATGRVVFDRLGAPPWTVQVLAPGYASVTRASVSADLEVTLRALAALDVRVVAARGAPAAAATITIVGDRLWPPRKATTGVDGTARIAGLLEGTYDLRATSGDQVSDTRYGLALNAGAVEDVTLTLHPGRWVWVAVVDGEAASAAPIPGAEVTLVEDGLGPFPMHGRTGADGKVALGPIPRGAATVNVRAEGYVGRGGMSVEPDAELTTVSLLRGATLAGRVVDERGFPVDGASVEIVGTDSYGMPIAETPQLRGFQASHFAWSMSGPKALIPAGELGVMPGPVPPIPRAGFESYLGAPMPPSSAWVTGGDGTFSVHPVTPGRIRAIVRHPGYVEGLSEVKLLAPGARAEVQVVLHAGGTLEGRVVDSRGFPVAGVRIDVSAAQGVLERSSRSAADGSFAFAALPSEVMVALARPEDSARLVVRRTLAVASGSRTRVDLVLPAPREVVRVRVLDPEGRPVVGAQVLVLGLDPETPLRQTRFTEEDGAILLDDARGLPIQVLVEAPDHPRAELTVARAEATLEVRLQRGVVVTGRVTAVRGRLPVEGATVALLSEGQRQVALSDRNGDFEVRDLAPGPLALVISHPEYARRELKWEVPASSRGRPVTLPPIDLEPTVTLRGVVLDAAGQPVPGARVALGELPAYLPVDTPLEGSTVTDAAGRFTLAGAGPGANPLSAFSARAGHGTATATVIPGRSEAEVRITLSPSALDDPEPGTANLALTLGERGRPVEVVIVQVAASSGAERAGLAAGDVLQRIDGRPVVSMREARSRLAGRAGSDVVLEVHRGERVLTLRVAREPVRR